MQPWVLWCNMVGKAGVRPQQGPEPQGRCPSQPSCRNDAQLFSNGAGLESPAGFSVTKQNSLQIVGFLQNLRGFSTTEHVSKAKPAGVCVAGQVSA